FVAFLSFVFLLVYQFQEVLFFSILTSCYVCVLISFDWFGYLYGCEKEKLRSCREKISKWQSQISPLLRLQPRR
ncbi:unnamed protein product, partial [Brassica oleracea var. botrytis]